MGLGFGSYTTGLIIDLGDGLSSVVPIYDGYTFDTAVQSLPIAGSDLSY